jgi:hypothetical protein
MELQLMEAGHTDPMKDQAKYAQTDARAATLLMAAAGPLRAGGKS